MNKSTKAKIEEAAEKWFFNDAEMKGAYPDVNGRWIPWTLLNAFKAGYTLASEENEKRINDVLDSYSRSRMEIKSLQSENARLKEKLEIAVKVLTEYRGVKEVKFIGAYLSITTYPLSDALEQIKDET
jgi:hypothetical protein